MEIKLFNKVEAFNFVMQYISLIDESYCSMDEVKHLISDFIDGGYWSFDKDNNINLLKLVLDWLFKDGVFRGCGQEFPLEYDDIIFIGDDKRLHLFIIDEIKKHLRQVKQ